MPPRTAFPPLLVGLLAPTLLIAGPGRAEEPAIPLVEHVPSKSGYHLFRPTPGPLLREMSTDRPDRTESAHTVDAGHVQVEVEAARFEREEAAGRKAEELGGLGINAKVGLLPSVDLQVVFGGAARRTETGSGTPEDEESGVGDATIRVKWNLWGNDDGPTALALMPFVTLPTGSEAFGERSARPGLIVPFGWTWPAGFDFGAMAQVDYADDADGTGHHAEWLTTATVGHALRGRVGAFAEFAATTRPVEEGAWIGTVDLGLVYGATANLQLDGGVILGVSEAAEGLGLFLGISMRR